MSLLSPEQIFAFLCAAVAITLAPGPDILMVLSLGVSKGAKQAMAFGTGAATACLIQTALVALGVAALIKAEPHVFMILKIVGCLYLLFLGTQAFRGSLKPVDPDADPTINNRLPPGSAGILFLKGMVANLTNPKVILFYLAFLPNQVDKTVGDEGLQILQFGIIFTLQAAVIFACVGFFAGVLRRFLLVHPRVPIWLDRIAAAVFVILGLSILFV